MSNALYTANDQRKYLLKLSGELIDKTSDYDIFSEDENGIKDIELMNELYRAFHYGGTELNIAFSEVFHWLKNPDPEILTIIPPYETGTISLTNGSTSGTLSDAPAVGLGSFKNYFLKIEGRKTVYRISAHTANSTSITLDQEYLEDTGATLSYKIIKLDYTLSSKVARIFKELRTEARQYDENSTGEIKFMSEDSFDSEYPRTSLNSGTPSAFTITVEDDDTLTLRFNRYPATKKVRVEVPYIPRPEELRVFEFGTGDVDTGNDRITETTHRLIDNQVVRFTTTDTLPSGLSLNTNYYVSVVDADTFGLLNARNGTAITLSDTGTGTHTLESVPKLPHGYRSILAEYGASIVMLDKSDPRSDSFLKRAQAKLQAIINENRRTGRKVSKDRGRLTPRLDDGYVRKRLRYFEDGY